MLARQAPGFLLTIIQVLPHPATRGIAWEQASTTEEKPPQSVARRKCYHSEFPPLEIGKS